MKHIALLFALIISALSQNTSLFAQDSTRISIPDSVRYAAFDTNIIAGTNRLSNNSEVFSYKEYIWSDKRNLTEIMEMRNGFKGYNQGLGLYNQFYDNQFVRYLPVSIYRDGFDLNTFDSEMISINEVDSVEIVSSISSYLYSDNYSTSTVNVISKDVVQPQAFSQLRYSQDRHDALYADVYFSQSFSKKFNLQFGLTKGSNAGRYTNSDYDKWQTRTKLNFFINPNFNIKTSFYYNTIERGLFGGLISDTSNVVVDDSLRSINKSIYFNTGFYLKLFNNRNNLTKLTFSYNNLKEELINSISPNMSYYTYETNINQNFEIPISNLITSNFILNAKYEYINSTFSPRELKLFSGFAKYDIYYNNLNISVFYKQVKSEFTDSFISGTTAINNYYSPGIEAGYKLINSNDLKVNLFGGINYSGAKNNHPDLIPHNYINSEAGIMLTYKKIFSKFRYRYGNLYDDSRFVINDSTFSVKRFNYRFDSYNINIRFKVTDIVFDLINDYYIYSNDNLNLFRANVFYENKLFNNNLDLKTGFIVKYYSNLFFFNYNTDPSTPITTDLFNFDFYIGARIGSANVNFTLANLFNRVNYDTYLYPYDDRGGFANVVSRFTIVWDFLN